VSFRNCFINNVGHNVPAVEQEAAGNLIQEKRVAGAYGYRILVIDYLVSVSAKRESRTDCVTVVILCEGTTVNLSQNKHPDLLNYCRGENQSASLTQAAFSCSSPLFGLKKVQYAKA
jgi:hypothetical protein